MAQSGFPQLTRGDWIGFWAPAGTSPDIVNRLNREINAGLTTPETQAAMKKLGEKADDRKAFAEALHQIAVADTPRGAIKFDQYGNVVGDVFIRRCEKKGGQLVNTLIKTYPNVSQFWTYPEKDFLANPVYTRDYPPAKNLEN